MVGMTPPSTRSAAPFVGEERRLATQSILLVASAAAESRPPTLSAEASALVGEYSTLGKAYIADDAARICRTAACTLMSSSALPRSTDARRGSPLTPVSARPNAG